MINSRSRVIRSDDDDDVETEARAHESVIEVLFPGGMYDSVFNFAVNQFYWGWKQSVRMFGDSCALTYAELMRLEYFLNMTEGRDSGFMSRFD